MATKIEICNNILVRLGQNPNVGNIEKPTNEEERIFGRFFNRELKKAILKYKPSCCEARLSLSQDIDFVPEWGFSSGYELPSDLLQVLEVDGDKWTGDKYPIEAGFILTDMPLGTIDSPAKALSIRALMFKDVTDLDDAFLDLFEKSFAQVIVFSLIKDQNERNNLMNILRIDSYDFANKESDESGVEVINGSNILDIQWSSRK